MKRLKLLWACIGMSVILVACGNNTYLEQEKSNIEHYLSEYDQYGTMSDEQAQLLSQLNHGTLITYEGEYRDRFDEVTELMRTKQINELREAYIALDGDQDMSEPDRPGVAELSESEQKYGRFVLRYAKIYLDEGGVMSVEDLESIIRGMNSIKTNVNSYDWNSFDNLVEYMQAGNVSQATTQYFELADIYGVE
ncbi:hypothetical protein SAMN05720606_12095 [Paenibacillus polysaccharolyticus]|uniref:Lipoprotein n=1 Tax=Paenibacillus polysaccharolyticus TaxID=582692 RepID=A0A1G5L7W7_9BACL|nr:hypothetical protein [Paenibacillus polysaccharolyticus]SCZ08370.1 hypothetical protein SAMN05720606_12095 [Paenibacillus polysaccharolyticus]